MKPFPRIPKPPTIKSDVHTASTILIPSTAHEIACLEYGIQTYFMRHWTPRFGFPLRVLIGENRRRDFVVAEAICDTAEIVTMSAAPQELLDAALIDRYIREDYPDRFCGFWHISAFRKYPHPVPISEFNIPFPAVPWCYVWDYHDPFPDEEALTHAK